MQLIESVLADAQAIKLIRRDIHANPELCFQEQRTSDLVAKLLTEWGIPVIRGLGKTGVVTSRLRNALALLRRAESHRFVMGRDVERNVETLLAFLARHAVSPPAG